MPRFAMNRQWAFILTLCVSFMCAFAVPSFATDYPDGRVIDDPYIPEFPNGIGDPDAPDMGKFAKRVQIERGSMGGGWRSAGDRSSTYGVMMMRLRIVLRGIGIATLRF